MSTAARNATVSYNSVAHINEVTLRRARLVLGWVTVRELETPGRFEVRKSSSQVMHPESGGAPFPQKKLTTFLVVAVKTQAANAADCFSVKIKQIKRSDNGNNFHFLFTLLPKQSNRQGGARAVDLPARSSAPWCSAATGAIITVDDYDDSICYFKCYWSSLTHKHRYFNDILYQRLHTFLHIMLYGVSIFYFHVY